jgi:bifunctional non-homologous end joining protein LigD
VFALNHNVPVKRRLSPDTLEPMYATIGTEVPREGIWTFEPKYDGMRALAFVSATRVRLMTRNGKDKAAQFPEVAEALRALGRRRRRPVILDGEIVALESNRPGHFQALQGRFQLKSPDDIARAARETPAAMFVFDILADGSDVLIGDSQMVRRARLEGVVKAASGTVRLSESSPNGTRMIARARAGGWEGVIAKRASSAYTPGARSRDWLKLKLQHREEFVVGGYTEPRRTRPYLGAILLGYFDRQGTLRYVGHTGGGFHRESLREMCERLAPLKQPECPFREVPRTNERAHWVKPKVVVEVKFAEWTSDGRLRQPIFLGVRDDKNARDVHLERESIQRLGSARKRGAREKAGTLERRAARRTTKQARATGKKKPRSPVDIATQIERLTSAGHEGTLNFGGRKSLHVSSLDKVFFGESGITKGDLMRYYATVASALLPVLRDRPLILKRYPNGIDGPHFFQQNAGAHPPEWVRTAEVETEDGERATRIVGGDLLTLLYTVQLGTIAVHPWQSRLPRVDDADYSTIDLDPGPGVPFQQVVELATLIGQELERLSLVAALKTSGSRGLHIVLPLPARTNYQRSARLAEVVAAHIASRHPKLATLARGIKERPRGTIYVDAQQNARGKSVASAYSVRERSGATVSAPLQWSELNEKLRLDDFTIETVPRRLERVGDIWARAMKRRNTVRAIDRVLSEASKR